MGQFKVDYKPRHTYDSRFSLSSPENEQYINRLAKWLMARINKAALPRHLKHPGVKDNGAPGKKVTITHKQLVQRIVDTNGTTFDGTKIYFGPIAFMTNPTRAIKLGLMTADENSRKPSADREKSNLKNGSKGEYSFQNIRVITKRQNLAKGADDFPEVTNPNITVTVGSVELVIGNCSAQYLAEYTQSLVV